MDIEMSETDFKVVRLTAQIFQPGEYELRRLAENGIAIVRCDDEDPMAIARAVTDADVVATIGTPLPKLVIDALGKGRARAIARIGTGTDRIDVARATELGILVCNTPYFCAEDMADHVMAMILHFNRWLGPAHRAMQDGDLARARRFIRRTNRMSASTLGLIGFGRSAVHVARRARGFGMRVLATRSRPGAPSDEADALGVEMTDLDTVLRASDYVSLHVPLTRHTVNMIDDAALAKMKPGAVLINTSRGKLVDEAALYRALTQGLIAGAGIDTWSSIDIFVDRIDPPLTPLASLENVILSPHIANGSVQAGFEMIDAVVHNLIDLRAGRMPAAATIVNPEVRPRFPFES
jgi:phosphoglycerate dehydrogenase-like enzyme